ncbi:aminotransferase class I/II-fold pyridoxal phosphate-dependent enzyme [Candidatus Thorarchaeota archaeon]|nr:MAG: aminotransferase class I/II-fold pyridoxal phosphate-dependent enzyme [Candidatus Thorarchaeota archaeon]
MTLEPFLLERIQSKWEHIVDINLTESGVLPLSIRELVPDENELTEMLRTPLGYSQTNGTMLLREAIADMYPGATAENILVTNGGAEANFLTIWNLLSESDRQNQVIMMQPNYNQINGITTAFGGVVRPYYLEMHHDKWVPDIESLKEQVSKETLVITICNPNNPTGTIIGSDYLQAVAEIAGDYGAWILSDEVYQGAEMNGVLTPSMFGQYEKAIVTNSLSKAYGLPGLRLGWIVTPEKDHAESLWSYSDYTTICPSIISDRLATIALQPEKRKELLARATTIVRASWSLMEGWLNDHDDIFDYVAPMAASICFPKHNLPLSSLELVERLRKEKSLLIAPGEYFGMEKHLRIGFGYSEEHLIGGLSIIDEMISNLI